MFLLKMLWRCAKGETLDYKTIASLPGEIIPSEGFCQNVKYTATVSFYIDLGAAKEREPCNRLFWIRWYQCSIGTHGRTLIPFKMNSMYFLFFLRYNARPELRYKLSSNSECKVKQLFRCILENSNIYTCNKFKKVYMIKTLFAWYIWTDQPMQLHFQITSS